ncbi:conjugal transfer protein TraD [Consotaella aegiceratis]|uniref:conjugal transfer protein TraD n=1 Tax=Consotaella aegiceratis TaxID=3097961 RepID=UPI002F421B8D
MRTWQVERRKRTRHLIELGGLVIKAGIVDLTGDDRAMIYGALIWMADKLKSEEGERARSLWAGKGNSRRSGSQCRFAASGHLRPVWPSRTSRSSAHRHPSVAL